MSTRRRVLFGAFFFLTLGLCGGEALALTAPPAWGAEIRIGWLVAAGVGLVTLAELWLRRGAVSFRALSDLARRLSPPVNLEPILDAGLAHAVQLLGAEAGTLRLLEEDGTLRTASHLNASDAQCKVALPGELTERILQEGVPVVLTGAAITEEIAALLPRPEARVALLVPVTSGGLPFGLIATVYRRRKQFLNTDLETLRALGTQVGAAVANGRIYEGLLRESRTDPLTGVGSRRHFEDLYRREISRARRSGRPLSLAVIDVDHFKKINDGWGHLTGDRVLKVIGSLFHDMRASDVVARYGGDEFVVLMPDTRLADAKRVIHRIRERVECLNVEGCFPFPLRLSIGGAELGPELDLIAEADAAMYADKQARPPCSLSSKSLTESAFSAT